MLTVLRFDDPLPFRPRRVLVAGVSGAGKTTLARRIAPILNARYTEIDGLYHGPGWVPRDEFMGDVHALVNEPAWVTEWQYSSARPILTARADLMVWLDLPFLTVTFPRIAGRTVTRRLTREVLWNGNVEPPLHSFFTHREHILRWAIATRNKYRGLIPRLEREQPQLTIVRLGSPRQVEAWLAGALSDA